MFNDIGSKIKSLAKIISGVGIVVSLVISIFVFVTLHSTGFIEDEYSIVISIFLIVIGVALSWLATFLLYGYGELIDQTAEIKSFLASTNDKKIIKAKIEELKEWKDKGIITEVEYIEKIKTL